MALKIKKTKRKTSIKPIIIALIVIFVVCFGSAIAAIIYYNASLKPMECANVDESCVSAELGFVVPQGSGAAKIAEDLQDAGLIRSALTFRIYLKIDKKDLTLQAGSYKLKKSMSVDQIIERLHAGPDADVFSITFLPGGTMMDAKKRLKDAGYNDADIDAAFAKEYDRPLFNSRPKGVGIEGYIWGDTYEVFSSATVEEILNKPFSEMEKFIKENDLEAKYKAQGLTLWQGINLASVVQREAGSLKSDMPQVAQVFLKRYRDGWALGSDAVVAYRATQLNPNRKSSDLSYLSTMSCPWNSRKCKGLPPTPIATPGREALLAVANPAAGDYYFFFTGDDYKMYYSRTEAEHTSNVKKYCKERCKYI